MSRLAGVAAAIATLAIRPERFASSDPLERAQREELRHVLDNARRGAPWGGYLHRSSQEQRRKRARRGGKR